MGCIIASFLLAVHQWGDLWCVLFLAFFLQYFSGEISEVHYSKLFTCSTSVGRSVGCIIPSFLLAVHQCGDL